MKFAASVSLAALALAACATPTAPPVAIAEDPAPAAPVSAGEPVRTAEGAREFVARVEKDLFDLSVISGRAQWVNATYITDDTDALAAHFGTIGTEKQVQYAKEAAQWIQVPGLDPDTQRKLNILRTGLVLPAPSAPGAATELNEIATKLQSMYGKGRATHKGKSITVGAPAAKAHLRHGDHTGRC